MGHFQSYPRSFGGNLIFEFMTIFRRRPLTHLPNLVSPKVVLRLSDRALILFLSFCKLSEVLKYIYMSNKNRERSRRY